MVKLQEVTYTEEGKKINYDYSVDHQTQKFFDSNQPYYVKYGVDVSKVPDSIAVIPFLSNIMPIAWFVGFDVYVPEVDETFYHSLLSLKEEFNTYHPEKKFKGSLKAEKLIQNKIEGEETCLLFSGGLDSFESYTRNYELNPYLVSIHGADVEITDTKRWGDFVRYNEEEKIVNTNKLFYIETNVRDFYTYQVELLVDLGWWGKIQHGMALIGVIAPLGYHFNISKIFIGSSNTEEIDFGWGSSPNIDEKMKWANSSVVHDGYHLRRTDKIDNIFEYSRQNDVLINLRVCYSEHRDGYNCNVCAKCQRTIFGLILSGANPNDFGFTVPDNLYELIFKNFGPNSAMTEGLKYEWKCLQIKASEVIEFFVLQDKDREQKEIEKFMTLDLDRIVNQKSGSRKTKQKLRFIIRNKFPWLRELYRKIRY